VAWTADAPGSPDKYLAVFNLDDEMKTAVAVKWSDLGLGEKCAVRDLWEKKDLGVFDIGFAPKLLPHDAGLYRVTPER
jgi:hypothetical protein